MIPLLAIGSFAIQYKVALSGESLAWDNVKTRFESQQFSWFKSNRKELTTQSKQAQKKTLKIVDSLEALEESLQLVFKIASKSETNTRANMLEYTIICYYLCTSGRPPKWSHMDRIFAYWDKAQKLDLIESKWALYLMTSCYPQSWQIRHLKKLQAYYPNNAMHDMHIVRLAHLDKKEWQYAIELGSKWSKIYPEYGTIHGNFGRFLLDIGEKARRKEWVLKSIESFEKGIASKICFDSYRETMKMHLRAARELAKEL